jgi:hypothetical protein
MRKSLSLVVSALVASTFVAGCGAGNQAAPGSADGAAVQGRVLGGQQPISGARVYLMAANTTGYGNASVSLLSGSITGYTDSIGAYTTTNATGGFSITGDYTCTSTQQIYLLAVGGDAGSGTNASSALMAVLGQCPAGATTFASALPFISVNEVTTVAGAYALAGYMTDMLHVSSSGTALAGVGMANAFVSAANLANIATGTANAVTPAGNGVAPQAKINTLANILASCVNSDGSVSATPTATSCYTLFSNATSNGTSTGTLPAETVTAAVNMAHNPGAHVANLLALPMGVTPFQPVVSSASELSLALSFSGGGLDNPYKIAVDGFGNIWAQNSGDAVVSPNGSITKFAAGTVAPLSPVGVGFTSGGIARPEAIAIDQSNNIWVGDGTINGQPHARVSKLAQDGSAISATGYALGYTDFVEDIAMDAQGNALIYYTGSYGTKINGVTGAVTVQTNGGVSGYSDTLAISPNGNRWVGVSLNNLGLEELDPNGTFISPPPQFHSYGLTNPGGIVIDHAGKVWVVNGGTINGQEQSGLAVFNGDQTLLSATGNFDPVGYQTAVAIDGAGHIFVSHIDNFITELNNDGSPVASAGSFGDTLTAGIGGIAVDGSGNLWVKDSSSFLIKEFVGAAVPVVTPIAAGVTNNTLGTRP